ncbi:MAG: deoxyribose-phosphate aldolase [Corynebacterium glucuronolyticum]|nr:deoxyribose-phosphate aldolase [Corynebacterium glucuronolyticum]
MNRSELAQLIDHTLLKPESTADDVAALAAEAGELGTYSVCVSPSMLPVDVPPTVKVATVIGFPSGAVKTSVKVAEARQAVADGADEVDMVQNIGWAKEHRFDEIADEIAAVKAECPMLKVILETAALTDEEIVECCKAAEKAGADFVKTSTGFHPAGGASVHAVSLMKETVGDRLGVKASGGIRDAATALAMVSAGATRLGLSSSKAVLDGLA